MTEITSWIRLILVGIEGSKEEARKLKKEHHDSCRILMAKASHKASSESAQKETTQLQGQLWATRRSLVEANNAICHNITSALPSTL